MDTEKENENERLRMAHNGWLGISIFLFCLLILGSYACYVTASNYNDTLTNLISEYNDSMQNYEALYPKIRGHDLRPYQYETAWMNRTLYCQDLDNDGDVDLYTGEECGTKPRNDTVLEIVIGFYKNDSLRFDTIRWR